jgi:hypothetical protein
MNDINIRRLSGENSEYYKLNREERNLCATLYHLLLENNNLKKFLTLIDCKYEVNEPEIYVEYAFIRDIWHKIKEQKTTPNSNQKKKNIIMECFPSKRKDWEKKDISGFNAVFISARAPSVKEIESPSNWNVKKLSETFENDKQEFLNACIFKWAFNAKPDMVIHTSQNTAICIECKLESGESTYPSNAEEKKIFDQLRLARVKQTEVQEKIMKLLGFDAQHINIAKQKLPNENTFTWKEIFSKLERPNSPFIQKWLISQNFIDPNT